MTVASAALAQPSLPVSPEVERLFRLASIVQRAARFYDAPHDELAFSALNVVGEGARSARIRAYQRVFSDALRHSWSEKLSRGELFFDAGIGVTGVVETDRTDSKRLGAFSLRTRVGGEFGERWLAALDVISRAEGGSVSLSPFVSETDTGEYDSARTPNVVQTYLTWRNDWLRASVGRQTTNWGPGARGGLLLSDFAGPMPMAKLDAQLDWLRITALTARLEGPEVERDVRIPKFLAAHRVEIAPTTWLNMAVAESVVWINRFDLKFANPIDLFYLDVRPNDPDNRNLSLEMNWFIQGRAHAYAELLIDDFQPQEGVNAFRAWGTKGGLTVGGRWIDPLAIPNTDMGVEYVFVNQYAYTHKQSGAEYTHRNLPLGHPIGGDAESAWMQIGFDWSLHWRASVEWERIRDGEGNLLTPHTRSDPDTWNYLSDVVETTRRWNVGVEYREIGGYYARIELRRSFTANEGHRYGVRSNSTTAFVEFGYGSLP